MKNFSPSIIALLFVSSSMVACAAGTTEEEAVGEAEQALCRWEYMNTPYENSLGQWFTPQQTTSSGCGHIWVENYTNGCVSAFIRYYPHSGGSFDSGSAWVCYNTY